MKKLHTLLCLLLTPACALAADKPIISFDAKTVSGSVSSIAVLGYSYV